MRTIRAVVALARREFTRFIRQPQRVIGSIGQPVLFWLFLGTGFTGSFRPPGMEGISYLEFFYPGVLLMLLLFASIFSSITVIEDRDQGFLQSVLVAPVSRLVIVFGKVLGGTLIALTQALLFLGVAPFLGLFLSPAGAVLELLLLILTAFGFTVLGFLCAWSMKSTAGFHAIMMVFLMPLWLLSGALFPLQHVPPWLQVVMEINPVTHALVLLRLPFYHAAAQLLHNQDFLVSLGIVILWVVGCMWLAVVRVEQRDRGAAL
ncbi:ABC transporter, permease protein [invertebrate metagenome]|uniref:ABC transporter, permease protein n=1 Tax=invertebrate metagenome TaxID=1711999 RepID=A0A484H738_9ZZZZ